jgi:phospholipid/cholesterol/gamma-HCH transport system ATP-binding protein
VISVEALTMHFPGHVGPLLRGIDLQIEKGGTWGLVGPGASGKTVLCKLICGLLQPSAGKIAVAGHEVSGASEDALIRVRSMVGMLFQNYALFDFMTVAQNVAFPLVQKGELDRSSIEERVDKALRAVGLATSGHKFPSELSGGMKKRAGLARAVISRPPVHIYDEPTAGLDPVTTSKIYDLLRMEREETGATVVVVSSDVEALRKFAPRVALLYQGRLHYDGPSDAMERSSDPVVRQFVTGALEGPL